MNNCRTGWSVSNGGGGLEEEVMDGGGGKCGRTDRHLCRCLTLEEIFDLPRQLAIPPSSTPGL